MQSQPSPSQLNSPSDQLRRALCELSNHRFPSLKAPGCKKRASVALIIRVRPTFLDQAFFDAEKYGSKIGEDDSRLESFFEQEWVKRGDPEVLFIKRAARKGDRWTSHIAFPGGGRDPADEDDAATSVRETMEEIGLDLKAEHCLRVGNLSERIVTTWLGKTPLMVLCTFIFLLLRFDTGPLNLQPSEVHSAHWVSLRALMSPQLNTYISTDVSGRFDRPGGLFTQGLARLLFGQMLVKAIDLVPTESVYCSSSPVFLPPDQNTSISSFVKVPHWLSNSKGWQRPSQQLMLWGLTLGVMSDFLRAHPSCDVSNLWAWPTLSPVDHQFFIWLSTYSYRKQKIHDLESKTVMTDNDSKKAASLSGLGEIDNTTFTILKPQGQRGIQDSDLLDVLGGYYDRAKNAAFLTVALRLGFAGLFTSWAIQRLQSRRSLN